MTSSDIRQSSEFASFMVDIKWKVKQICGNNVFLKKFPIIGSFAKYPRFAPPIDTQELLNFIRGEKIFRFKISPNLSTSQKNCLSLKNKLLKSGFKIDTDPFNPTTTILVDLSKNEKEIFDSFSEAKRRGARRAIKNGVNVILSDNIDAFIKIRHFQYSPLGFLVTKEMKMLWKNFYPDKAHLLLAKENRGKYIAGILLLYHERTAYYWYASALKEGKKMFAPTLLVWEAIKTAKKRGCKILDFEGVYDSRFPKASESWRGFTKFKEGFSNKKIVFMENFIR